jgi:hypothetical protein
MAQVVDPSILEPGAGAQPLPEGLQVDQVTPGLMP